MEKKFEDSIQYYWIRNLVGTPFLFSANLFITLVFGLLYSFRVVYSDIILIFFGMITSIVYIVLCYHLISNNLRIKIMLRLPEWFFQKKKSRMLMVMDSLVIVSLVAILFFDIFNNLVMRIMVTVFVPLFSLIILRILYMVYPKE